MTGRKLASSRAVALAFSFYALMLTPAGIYFGMERIKFGLRSYNWPTENKLRIFAYKRYNES